MDDKQEEKKSELCLADEERQPCEVWTRRCDGIFQKNLRF